MPRSHSFAKCVKSPPAGDTAIVTFRKSCVIRPVKNRDPKMSESHCNRCFFVCNFPDDVSRCIEVPTGTNCRRMLSPGTAPTPFVTISRVTFSPSGRATRKHLSGLRQAFNMCNNRSFGLTRYPLASQQGYLCPMSSPERLRDVRCGHQENHCKTSAPHDVDF